jgi:hypothetical protein
MGPSGAAGSEFGDHSGIFTITDNDCHWRYEHSGFCEPLRYA